MPAGRAKAAVRAAGPLLPNTLYGSPRPLPRPPRASGRRTGRSVEGMRLRTSLAYLSGVGSALALVGAAGVGVRRFLVRRNAAAATLNDLLPVHSAWWRARLDRSGRLLYVALGDSTAQGIGATNPGRSYVGRLAGKLRSDTHG